MINRRQFLTTSSALILSSSPSLLMAGVNDPNENKKIKLYHQHTNEKINVTFWRNGWFDHSAFEEINHFFRDWHDDKTKQIDPYLIELLYNINESSGGGRELVLLSGYRTPNTNEKLVNHPRYRAAKNSLHMFGRAVDFYIPKFKLSSTRSIARKISKGGVGYYPSKSFVHVDTGQVRYWTG